MIAANELPGTPRQKALLAAVASHYEHDDRILALIVFGSLGRGDWDQYSDLDLDMVTTDGVQVEVESEITRLGASLQGIGERIALVIPSEEEADVVFHSLLEMSVRYHPLATTKPAILDSMRLILARIDRAAIENAGQSNQVAATEPLQRELDRCLRYALEVDNALRRGRPWSAVELLHAMRRNIMTLFTRSHGGERAYQFFEKHADQGLQARLGAALPQGDPASARRSLVHLLDLLANDLDLLTDGKGKISQAQEELLTRIITRRQEHDQDTDR